MPCKELLADWINSLPTGPGMLLKLNNPGGGNIVTGAFTIQVQFTAAVSGLSSNQFQMVNGHAGSLTGSGTNHTLSVQPDATGLVMIKLPGGQVIDGSGRPDYPSSTLKVTSTLADGLVTWLPFDEANGSSSSDASGHSNPGTLFNMSPTAWSPGLFGGATSVRWDE